METINTCIKFNQTPKLKQKAKNNVEKVFFKLMNNAVFRKKYGKCEEKEILILLQQKGESWYNILMENSHINE